MIRSIRMARTICVAVVALLLSAMPALAAKVDTRAGKHPDFGRIVFDWSRSISYEAVVEGELLRVRFEEPVETDLSIVPRVLVDYVRSARLEQNGKVATFALRRAFDIRSFVVGERSVVVDLLAKGALAAAPEAAPAGPDGAAVGRGRIGTRVGRHPTFTRVVFDWMRPVDYQVAQDGAEVRIVFAQASSIDVATLARRSSGRITRAGAELGDDRITVTLALAGKNRIRNFRHGTKVVLDVLDGSEDPQAPPAVERKSARDAGRMAARAARRGIPSLSSRQTARAAGSGPASRVQGDSRSMRPGTSARRPSDPVSPISSLMLANENGVAETDEAAAFLDPGLDPSRVLESDDIGTVAEAAPDSAQIKSRLEIVPVVVKPTEGGLELSFLWSTETAAAVFFRADRLWVVFDRRGTFDLSEVPLSPVGPVIAGRQIEDVAGAVLMFTLSAGLQARASESGGLWSVELGESVAEERPEFELRQEIEGGKGPRLLLNARGATAPLRIVDPEIGDSMVVVPVQVPVRQISKNRDFVEFSLLPTAHGLALVSRADGLRVRHQGNGIEVSKPEGLLLSSDRAGTSQPRIDSEQLEREARAEQQIQATVDRLRAERDIDPTKSPLEQPGPYLRLLEWVGTNPGRFNVALKAHLRSIASSPPIMRNQPRLELARFYLAHGFAADARALFPVMEAQDPTLIDMPHYRALRGAAHFLLNRIPEAHKDFSLTQFDGDTEIAAWRGAIAVANADWAEAQQMFDIAGEWPDYYPRELKLQFTLLKARAELAVNDYDSADDMLTELAEQEEIPTDIKAETAYLLGQARERLGHIDEALESYRLAATSKSRPIVARAQFARASLLLRKGELVPLDAIEQFERLRYSWRGDAFELQVLRELGRLYSEHGDYRKGLQVMRHAITYFPRTAETRAIAKEMNDVFERLFLDGAADNLPPVKALAVYHEFRELTPLGPRGDEMIRRLADRLVAVDLLGQAAELLQHQIKFRVKRDQKAKVGAQLALIRLLDRKPKKALQALASTKWGDVSARLRLERRHLQVRALATLNRHDEALDLVARDRSSDSRRLRADIHWRKRDWPSAVGAFQELVDDSTQSGDDILDPVRGRQVLKLAIARVLVGDREGVSALRERFIARFAEGADLEAFKVITDRVDPSATALRQLAGQIADTEQLEAFLAGYRKRLASKGLRTIE